MAKKEMQRSRMHYKNTLWPLLVLLVMALSFVYFKGILPDPKQVKIGVTYMTMNNDFYKTLNAELEKKTNQESRANRLIFSSKKR